MSKVYKIITDKIINQLEKGVIPWRKPFVGQGSISNFVSKKAYTGINPFLLNASGYSCPHWLTFKQAKDLEGCVKKGEKGEMIIFFAMKDYENSEGVEKKIPILRYYTVFNLEQCEGIEWDKPVVNNDFKPIEACEELVKLYPGRPAIKTGNQAYYTPSQDTVTIPGQDQFISEPEYYSTLFHELVHSTGHKNRLSRDGITGEGNYFGSHEYSKEELVAEFGAAMLCGVSGIDNHTLDNNAAYIKSWVKQLRNDDKLIIQAASKAQKAANYIQNIK